MPLVTGHSFFSFNYKGSGKEQGDRFRGPRFPSEGDAEGGLSSYVACGEWPFFF